MASIPSSILSPLASSNQRTKQTKLIRPSLFLARNWSSPPLGKVALPWPWWKKRCCFTPPPVAPLSDVYLSTPQILHLPRKRLELVRTTPLLPASLIYIQCETTQSFFSMPILAVAATQFLAFLSLQCQCNRPANRNKLTTKRGEMRGCSGSETK